MKLPPFLRPLVAVPAATTSVPLGEKATATSGSNPLSFSMQSQQQSEWCWAATAASVSAFYCDTPAASQCEIASRCLSMSCCITPLPPPPPPYWSGNRTYTLDVALSNLGHLVGGPTGACLDFNTIVAQIRAGHPVCCHISWDGGAPGGHFMAIIGYDESNADVTVVDPSPVFGDGTFPYKALVQDYHGGQWDDTYLTQ
jgi:hypothetical protein